MKYLHIYIIAHKEAQFMNVSLLVHLHTDREGKNNLLVEISVLKCSSLRPNYSKLVDPLILS